MNSSIHKQVALNHFKLPEIDRYRGPVDMALTISFKFKSLESAKLTHRKNFKLF